MILNLIENTEPILHEKLERFDFGNPPVDPSELAINLTETMLKNDGIGLAANQVGLPYRVFVIRCSPVLCCFNPIIVDTSIERIKMEEGCLSYKGLILNIERPKSIRVRFTLPNGETKTEKFTGMTARIFQHEYQHLNGEIFTNNLTRLELEMAIKKANKKYETKYKISDFRCKIKT